MKKRLWRASSSSNIFFAISVVLGYQLSFNLSQFESAYFFSRVEISINYLRLAHKKVVTLTLIAFLHLLSVSLWPSRMSFAHVPCYSKRCSKLFEAENALKLWWFPWRREEGIFPCWICWAWASTQHAVHVCGNGQQVDLVRGGRQQVLRFWNISGLTPRTWIAGDGRSVALKYLRPLYLFIVAVWWVPQGFFQCSCMRLWCGYVSLKLINIFLTLFLGLNPRTKHRKFSLGSDLRKINSISLWKQEPGVV